MMLFKLKKTLLLALLALPLLGYPKGSSAQNSPALQQEFQEGLNAFATSQFEKARDHFKNALTQDPTSDTLLYNLALTEYRLGQNGWALAYLRKALLLNPWNRSSKNLFHEVESKIRSRNNSDWSPYTQLALLSETIPFGLTQTFAMLFFVALAYAYFRVRTAVPSNPLPTKLLIAGVVFVLIALFAGLQILIGLQPRASVALGTQAKTGPSDEQPELFLLPEGELVKVRETKGEWLRIENQASNQGWVRAENVFVVSQGDLTW